jgi:hypothetical protein
MGNRVGEVSETRISDRVDDGCSIQTHADSVVDWSFQHRNTTPLATAKPANQIAWM